MNSSSVILLFHDPQPLSRNPYSFLLSSGLHIAVVALIAYGLITAPRLAAPTQTARHAVRLLELHTPHLPPPAQSRTGEKEHTSQGAGTAPSRKTAPSLAAPHGEDPQTLAHTDYDNTDKMQNPIPVPALMLWAKANRPEEKIVPGAATHNLANIRHASLSAINQAATVTDQQITPLDTKTPAPELDTSHSAPVLLRNSTPGNDLPQTSSTNTLSPNSASILSISQLSMPEGVIALPSVQESASTEDDKPNGSLQLSSDNGKPPAGDGTGSPATRHLRQSPNGQYNVIVVGDSLEDEYPAIANLWAGRVAYTVYLHVGTAHNWILQFASTESEERSLEGNTVPLQAPWPIDIIVPALDPAQMAADALLVHGFVTEAGLFQDLSVSYPEKFPLTRFVLDALRQWHFRPSVLNGQRIKTEILLIIPFM